MTKANKLLTSIRVAVERLRASVDDAYVYSAADDAELAYDLKDTLRELDEHLSGGGELPTAWTTPRFTRDQVLRAANDGADIVLDELSLSDRDGDLISLVVNAALTRLDSPGADLDHVITKCYDTEPSEVRGWWSGWT